MIQHPNPSIDVNNQNNMKCLFSSLRMSFKIGIIHIITLDYDFCHNHNTWCKNQLLALFRHNVEHLHIDNYRVTDEQIIFLKGDNVDHPLFEKQIMYCWASMQKSDEHTFAICYPSKIMCRNMFRFQI